MEKIMIINILKTLSDVNRLRILNLLNQKPLCVCEIEYLLELNQSNLSRHLRNMNQLGLLDTWRENKFAYYKINEDFVKANPFIMEVFDRLTEEKQLQEDLDNFNAYIAENIPCACVTKMLLEKKYEQKEGS